MQRSILVVDDEKAIQNSLKGAVGDEGYRVVTASSGKEGLDLLKAERPDVLLLDIWMPEMDGLEVLQVIKAAYPHQVVIMMSGHGTIETAVKATKLGAYDFIEKPLSLERLLVLLKNAIGVLDLSTENQALRKQVKSSRILIGESPSIRQIKEMINRVAPTTGSVLITGENATGKEVVAHSLHSISQRFNKPFIEVDCAAIPEELIESELFGHEKGAFTGAMNLHRGKFDLADGGTLFLDEIGDMSLKTQAKILRILQEQKFERVGGTQNIAVDVRIIAATNKDLKGEIQKGQFREDLYYRLNVIPFHVPSLRDRREDIPLLADHFLKEFSGTHARKMRALTPEALAALTAYPWPGNVRELKNLIERLIILTADAEDGLPITAATILSHISPETAQVFTPSAQPGAGSQISAKNLRDARMEFEKDFILKTLKEQDGNVSKTAAVLGIERSHLHRKIKSYGIDTDSV